MEKPCEFLKELCIWWNSRPDICLPIEGTCKACGASLGFRGTCMGLEEETPIESQPEATTCDSKVDAWSQSRLNSENALLRETVDVLEDSLGSALYEKDCLEAQLRGCILEQSLVIEDQSREKVMLRRRIDMLRSRGEF